MFNKIKKEITECITGIKENPEQKVFILSTSILGFMVGIMISVQQINDIGLIGLTSMGGMLVGAGVGAAYVCCCCPPRKNHFIDNAPFIAESNTLSESSEPPAHAPSTSPTHAITVSYEAAPLVRTVDSKGTTFTIN